VAAAPVPDSPWTMTDPRRPCPAIPYTDADSETLVAELVDTLTIFRCPMGLGDAGATVSVLASIEAEITFQLLDAVADARDQDYTWNDIAKRLGTTASTARHRYAAYVRSRQELQYGPDNFIPSNTPASHARPADASPETPT
jgi:hypothetical protein